MTVSCHIETGVHPDLLCEFRANLKLLSDATTPAAAGGGSIRDETINLKNLFSVSLDALCPSKSASHSIITCSLKST
ncbi:hypothetical protein L596_007558 [Steinernema carpocapsae]|uniref:Uncharacterized protein n=1 Tax=Steinernema carpocapsae TaxID=34508 RepID=A0A4V6A612_STECR|nr:hypothetical protein L596_007558 [Steinernema carpocapsae]